MDEVPLLVGDVGDGTDGPTAEPAATCAAAAASTTVPSVVVDDKSATSLERRGRLDVPDMIVLLAAAAGF